MFHKLCIEDSLQNSEIQMEHRTFQFDQMLMKISDLIRFGTSELGKN